MSKIHHCEFCGTIGATKTHVEGTSYSGYFYLCEHCSENVGKYSIEGTTRDEFLSALEEIPELYMHGPKSSAFTRDRTSWGFLCKCTICSRKMDEVEGLGIGDDVIMTPLIKNALPPKYKNKESVYLCPRCTEKLQVKMISLIPMDKLPLQINTKEFQEHSGKEWEPLNDDLKSLVSKRLQGVPLEEINSLSSAKVLRCLDISVDYLTEKDRLTFKKDGEIKTTHNKVASNESYSDANPLIISEYEHGYMIYLSTVYPDGFPDFQNYMKKFGYTKMFREIIYKAIELEYNYIRFDTLGPRYKEFENPVK